jgi:hypothetical protein
MGKLTISMAIFNSKLLNYQRVSSANPFRETPAAFCPSPRRPAEIFVHGSVPRSEGRPTDFPNLRVDGFWRCLESTRDVTGKYEYNNKINIP